jgi:hypothetical protein
MRTIILPLFPKVVFLEAVFETCVVIVQNDMEVDLPFVYDS